MDCNMPYMDGPSATMEIREYFDQLIVSNSGQGSLEWKQPKIVAVTGHTEEMYIQRAMSCGMDAVIEKPATIRKI